MTTVYVINGPNLNMLGHREPEIYGHEKLSDIEQSCQAIAAGAGIELVFLQSNHEGQLVDWIQDAVGRVAAIVINAGAYTHTSIAIHDALKSYDGHVVELHISNPHAREPFRHVSYISPVANSIIVGLGVDGYRHAINILCAEVLPSQAARHG